MSQATESQIAMWRGAIAIIWANRQVDEAEKNLLLDYIKNNVFLSDAQRAQLMQDMEHKIELKDVWDAITSPEDRSYLIDITPSLFSRHGTPTAEERALYDKMFADQMATIDEESFRKDIEVIKAHIPVEMAQVETEYAQDFNNLGFIGRLIYHWDKKIDSLLS